MPTDLPSGVYYSISSAAFTQASVLFVGTGENVPATVVAFAEGDASFQWKVASVNPAKKTYTVHNQGNVPYPNTVPKGEAIVSASASASRKWTVTATGATNEYTICFNGPDGKPNYWTLPSSTSAVTLSKSPSAEAQKNWILYEVKGPVAKAASN